jgi:hypothetical protein
MTVYTSLSEAIQVSVQEIEQAAEKTVSEAGKFAREEALATTKFKVSASFQQATQFHKLDRFSGFVLADKSYATYLEDGNGPGRIYPRTAKALCFQVGGKTVFAKSVASHGPYRFMAEAGDKLDLEIENIFLTHLNAILT